MIIAIILCLIIIVLEILILTYSSKNPKTNIKINSPSVLSQIMSQPNSCELCYRMNDEMKAKCESAERSNFDKCDMDRQITYQNCLNRCN